MTDNNSAPERIWANGLGVYGEYAGFGGTEYIRTTPPAALQPTEAKPFKMCVSNDTLKSMIEADPDDADCDAGHFPTPPTDNTALVAEAEKRLKYGATGTEWIDLVARLPVALASREAPPAVTVAETPTARQLYDACMSYRHDFGLLEDDQRKSVEWQAREWWRCIARAMGGSN